MQEPHLNYFALIVAALIPMVMGFLYYHPAVLGKIWMNANGFTKESIGNGPKPVLYLLALGTSFLLSVFFWAWVTGAGGLEQSQVVDPVDGHSYVTFKHGAFHGMIFSILVLFPVFATMAIFEMKKVAWAIVNWGYWSITAVIMCAILSGWR